MLVIGIVLVLLVVRQADDTPSGVPSAAPSDTVSTVPSPSVDPTAVATAVGAAENPSIVRLDSFDPVEIEEGFEAVAVALPFTRAVAALPLPGDLLNIYRLPTFERIIPPLTTPAAADQTVPLPPIDAPAELLLEEVEILGMIGPLPAANGGVLTVILAVPSADVPLVLQLANSNDIYATLLPRPEETETPSEAPAPTPSATTP